MIYIYDILLNFNTSLIEFFEWEENDLIKYIKKIPIYKVSDDFLYNLVNNEIKIESNFLNNIKDKTLFDPNDEHIIAYGELNLTQGQTDWKDFSIKLEYRTKERKPKYIIVVASASKYGDYFTGSTTSTLWLDDFNLSYE